MQGIDTHIVLFFQSIRCPVLTYFFKIFILYYYFWAVVAIACILFFLFKTNKLKLPAISLFIAAKLATYGAKLVKICIHRPRPFVTVKAVVPLITVHGFSFPSSHATLAAAMAVVLAHHFPKARYAIFAIAILMGLSRAYFGIHYLSDILGGFILGGMVGWLSIMVEKLVIAATRGIEIPKQHR